MTPAERLFSDLEEVARRLRVPIDRRPSRRRPLGTWEHPTPGFPNGRIWLKPTLDLTAGEVLAHELSHAVIWPILPSRGVVAQLNPFGPLTLAKWEVFNEGITDAAAHRLVIASGVISPVLQRRGWFDARFRYEEMEALRPLAQDVAWEAADTLITLLREVRG